MIHDVVVVVVAVAFAIKERRDVKVLLVCLVSIMGETREPTKTQKIRQLLLKVDDGKENKSCLRNQYGYFVRKVQEIFPFTDNPDCVLIEVGEALVSSHETS